MSAGPLPSLQYRALRARLYSSFKPSNVIQITLEQTNVNILFSLSNLDKKTLKDKGHLRSICSLTDPIHVITIKNIFPLEFSDQEIFTS